MRGPVDTQEEERPDAVDRARRRVVLLVAAYALIFSVFSLLRYYSFRTLYYDLGIFSYSMSQVLHGAQGLQTLILPSTPGHIGHFSPILVIPLALYALLPSPATLLVFQSLLLALAALPLFELSFAVLHRADVSVGLSAVYLLYPALQGVNRYDFHVESFIPVLAFVLLFAVVRGRYRWFVAASLLLLITHEFVSVIFLWTAGVVLVYQLAARKTTVLGLVDRRWATTALGLGAAFFALENVLNIALTPSHNTILSWLDITTATFSGGTTNLLAGIGVDPWLKLLYWLLLLVPLAFLPLRDLPLTLPVVPWLGITILASNRGIYSIYNQYSAFVVSFLFFAALWALRRPRPFPGLRVPLHVIVVFLVSVGLFLTVTVGPLGPFNMQDGVTSSGFNPPYPPLVTAHDQATAALLGTIPADAAVLAQNELFSQVSNRATASPYWNVSADGPPGFIAVDTARTWFDTPVPPFPSSLASLVQGILANASYGVAGFSDSAFVYELGRTAPPDFTTEAVGLPSAAAFNGTWSALNATVTVGSTGLAIVPAPNAEGLAWTPLAPPDGVLVSTGFRWTGTSPGSWFGVLLGQPGTASFEAVAVLPSSARVLYVHVVNGTEISTPLGSASLVGNYADVEVLRSGGTLQAWVDGRLAGFVLHLPTTAAAAVGIAAFQQNVTVTSFAAYESTLGSPPFTPGLPWDGIAATVAILLPVTVALLVEPRPDRWLSRLRRVLGKPA